MTCDKCGTELQIGMFPFCGGTPEGHRRGSARVVQDSIIGGFWAENAWREPRYFDSQQAYEQALSRDGMMLKPKKPRHGRIIDQQMLDNARELVSRGGIAGSRPSAPLETFTLTTRVLDSQLRVRAEHD